MNAIVIILLTAFVLTPCVAAPQELSWRFEYDEAGRVSRSTDPAGKSTRFIYEKDKNGALQRITKSPPEGKPVVLDLDASGSPVHMTDDGGAVDYGYDDFGRLTQVQRKGEPAIVYDYDTLDHVTRLRIGNFHQMDYTYDFLGRLESVTTPAGTIRFDHITGQGTLIRTLPNGIKTIRQSEPNGRLQQITHLDSEGRVLAEFTYQYRHDGLIDAIRDRSPRGDVLWRYRYDTMGRLTQASGPSGEDYRYEYDALGNQTKVTAVGNPSRVCELDTLGRVTSRDGIPCSHDAAGNLTSMHQGDSGSRFSYTSDGLLKEFEGGKASYRYDGNGRLIARKVGNVETRFIPDPLSPYWLPLVVEEKSGKRTLVVWDGTAPLMMIRDGKPEYLLHDHLGSVRLVLDAQGKVMQRIDYDPFGKPFPLPAPTDFAPRFAGLFWEHEAQAYLTLARVYVPDLGRFLQPDPEKRVPNGSPKDLSLYAYCGGDPVNLVDLNGAEPHEPVSFDTQERWWNSFWRAYVYESFHWVRDFIGTGSSSLVVNIDPDVRDSVVRQLIGDAWEIQRQDVRGTWKLVKQWRESPESRPSEYRYSVTDQEWKAAENYMYARQWVETGKGVIPLPKGDVAARVVKYGGFSYWRLSHLIGEPLGISPGVFLRPLGAGSGDRAWLPITPKTRQWWDRAIDDALGGMAESGIGHQSNIWGLMPGPSVQIGKLKPPYQSKLKRPFDFYPPPFPPPGHLFDWNLIGWVEPWRPSGSGFASSTGRLSPVGGVYLGGAGKALEGVGLLNGIAMDPNKNLILLGNEGGQLSLPPLRVDDVVTIFRSVYLHGEGPTVSIDPASRNPDASAMIIRHGKATEDTFVGWILYEADRIMKGYTLGVDNKTEKVVSSGIPSYKDVLYSIYFGGGDPEKREKEGHWERFWIVPAEVRHFDGPRRELTLVDVPLKVKTQSMKWENGALVDDETGKSSPGATAFTGWFTANYDLVASEQFLPPPPESGITQAVPVFRELRRIALITAIAEKLRDQGMPMPFWMREHEVKQVPFEKTTPGLRVTRSHERVQARIFGGVQLSPATQDVKTFSKASDFGSLQAEERPAAQERIKLAEALEETIKTSTAQATPFRPEHLPKKGADVQAVTMPGAETRALVPCRLEEVDLSVPVSDGRAVELVRNHNSFFEPIGPWGKGWTMDLPRLEEVHVPIHRGNSDVQYGIAYELVTPLNTVHARFTKSGKVSALGGAEMMVPDKECDFLGLSETKSEFLSSPTRLVLLKDGTRWHFSKQGPLVAVEEDGLRTVYESDGTGKVTRIVGLLGRHKEAEIQLHYGAGGCIETAEGKNARGSESVRFEYGGDGKLAAVISGPGTVGYAYKGPMVSKISWRASGKDRGAEKEQVIRSFEYKANGQLLSETHGEDTRVDLRTVPSPDGSTLSVTARGKTEPTELIRYDAAMRPVEAAYADGAHTVWNYPPQGGVAMEATTRSGDRIQINQSPDRRKLTVQASHRPPVEMALDDAGRMVSLSMNGRKVLSQHWRSDGSLERIENEKYAAWREHDKDGLLSRVIMAPREEKGQFKHFQTIELDRGKRPIAIKDHRGLHLAFMYDDSGAVSAIINKRDGKDYGLSVDRDDHGRVRAVDSSWGRTDYAYDGEGRLRNVTVQKPGGKAAIDIKAGLIERVKQFDGGETTVSYNETGPLAGLPREVTCPNGLTLKYTYDVSARINKLDVGKQCQMILRYDKHGRTENIAWRPADQ